MNLPMGPTSTAQQWRIVARLGVAIMGAIAWTKTIKVRIALVTRIMEKDSWLTSLVIQHIINTCVAKGVLHHRQTAVFGLTVVLTTGQSSNCQTMPGGYFKPTISIRKHLMDANTI